MTDEERQGQLIERLHEITTWRPWLSECKEAANEIERLRADNEWLCDVAANKIKQQADEIERLSTELRQLRGHEIGS